MNLSKELTIILTLKDRSAFTHRWMRYMDDNACPYKILIADGGSDKAIEEHLKNKDNYASLDYDYIRYPFDASIEDFYKKFENVVARVQTKYTLLADNDDFYILDSIPEKITFLNTHEDYVGCRGQQVGFTLYDCAGKSQGLVKGNHYLARVYHQPSSIQDDVPIERVDFLLKNISSYYGNWYCIHRATDLKTIWKSFISLQIKSVHVTELLTLILLNMRGKTKIFSDCFYVRQYDTSQVSDQLIMGNNLLERFLIDNSFLELTRAIDQLLPLLTLSERDRLVKAIAAWLEKSVSTKYYKRMYVEKMFRFRLAQKIMRSATGALLLKILTAIIFQHFLIFRKVKYVSIKTIEPYILS